MSAEKKKLAEISFVTDTDVSYYTIGEPEGCFQRDDLKNYVKRFGHEKLCTHLAFLQYQIWDMAMELIQEDNREAMKDTK